MSQFYIGVTAGSLPPVVATSYVEDSGTAIPSSNVLNVNGGTSSANIANRILTTGSGNTITIELTNTINGSVTTSGAVDDVLISFPLGTTAGTYIFDCDIIAFNASTPAGAGFNVFGTVRTTGLAGTLIGIPDQIVNSETALNSAGIQFIVGTNTLSITVIGVLGLNIDWFGIIKYSFVS